jgi:hypothetical protein
MVVGDALGAPLEFMSPLRRGEPPSRRGKGGAERVNCFVWGPSRRHRAGGWRGPRPRCPPPR